VHWSLVYLFIPARRKRALKGEFMTPSNNDGSAQPQVVNLETLQAELMTLLLDEHRTRNEMRLNSVLRKERMGRVVDAIYRENPDESRARIEAVARELNISPSTLWRYRGIVVRFDRGEINSLLGRRTPSGKAISWTHLAVVSRLWNRDTRQRFLETVFSADLSAEQLRHRIIDHERPSSRFGTTVPAAETASSVPA